MKLEMSKKLAIPDLAKTINGCDDWGNPIKYFIINHEESEYMSEHCQICGEEYGEKYGYIWNVSDKLWEKVTGIKNESGLRCINCFSREAKKKGICIKWEGKETNV